ncbi:hypothetical protein [Mycoplasma buteonis]|uniref:hypothetical protein n=1 Tax=Mycoplasma buteonis TaxID=171280 RepID=UPI000565720D|nr:hypothetical protein [Mycoplasma buteonis]
MKKQNKLTKGFLIANSLLGAVAVGMGATIAASYNKEKQNKHEDIYSHLIQTNNLLEKYGYQLPDNQELKDSIESSKEFWKNEQPSDLKIQNFKETENKVFESFIANANKMQFSSKEQEAQFWNDLIQNQASRIREQDLNNQFWQIQNLDLKVLADQIANAEGETKEQLINEFAKSARENLNEQDDILNSYIARYNALKEFNKDLNLAGLSTKIDSYIAQANKQMLVKPFRFNDLDVTLRHAEAIRYEIEHNEEEYTSEHEKYNQSLAKLEQLKDSEVLSDNLKDALNNFLEKANKDWKEAQSINEIKNLTLANELFYEQIKDQDKNVSELQQDMRSLNPYIEKFSPTLNEAKISLQNQILELSKSSDKNALITAKNNLFKEFFQVSKINDFISDFENDLAFGTKYNYVTEGEQSEYQDKFAKILNSTNDNSQKLEEITKIAGDLKNELKQRKFAFNQIEVLKQQMIQVANDTIADSEIKTQINKLNQHISDSFVVKNVNSAYLDSAKIKFDEEFRNILKNQLQKLILDSKKYLVKLDKDPRYTKAVADRIRNLNIESEKLVKSFNPATSSQLEYQISLYKKAFINANNVLSLAAAEKRSKLADQVLDSAFVHKDGTDLTDNEKGRINLFNDLKDQLKELEKQVNAGNTDPNIANQIDDLKNKLSQMIDTANEMQQLSAISQEADKTQKALAKASNKPELAPYLDKINQLQNEVNDLFNNPLATKEQINEAKAKLQEAVDKANEKYRKLEIEDALAKMKAAIDENFGNSDSPAARAALAKYNELKAKGDTLTDIQNAELLVDKINKATELVKPLYDLEIEKQKLLDTIDKISKGEYKDEKSEEALNKANQEIEKADALIEEMNQPDNIPNLNNYELEKQELINRNVELQVAYQQDKLLNLNSQIQATKVSQNPDNVKVYNNYNDAIGKVNTFVLYKQNTNNLEEITTVASTFEHQRDLALAMSNLIEAHKKYNNPEDESVAQYIANVMNDNEMLATDTPEQIDEKIQKAKDALYIAQVKKEFSDAYNELYKVLGNNRNWKIYQSLNNKINILQEKKNNILYNDLLTVPEIKAEQVLLLQEVRDAIDEKNEILKKFEIETEKTNEIQTQIEEQIKNFKNEHPSFSETNFNREKDRYLEDQKLENRESFGFQEVENYRTSLLVAYYKDLAKYHLGEFEKEANKVDPEESEQHKQISTWSKAFVKEIDYQIESASSKEALEVIIEKISKENRLFKLQKEVADYIKNKSATEKQTSEQINSINNLKNALTASEPKSANNYADLFDLYQKLNDAYNKEISVVEIRERIIALTGENQTEEKKATGIKGELNEKLAQQVNGYDPQASKAVNKVLDGIKADSINETLKERLVEKFNKTIQIQNDLDKIVSTAAKVKEADDLIKNNSSISSLIVRQALRDLNAQIKIARNKYANVDNSDEYTEIQAKLDKYIGRANKIIVLAKETDLLRNQIQNTNYFSLNGVSGNNEKAKQTAFIKLFEDNAIDDGTINEKIADLTEQVKKFKEIVSLQNEISNKVTEWSHLGATWNQVDQKNATQLLWDLVITNSKNSNIYDLNNSNWNENLEALRENANNQFRAIILKNEIRSANQTKIENIKKVQFTQEENQLKTKLSEFLNTLEKQNSNLNDEQGLQTLQNNLVKLENSIPKLKELSAEVNNLQNLIQQIFNEDPEAQIYKDKQLSIQLINNAVDMFSKINEQSDIETAIEKVHTQYVRMDILFTFEIIYKKFLNNKVLENSDRVQIQNIIDSFERDYNNPEIPIEDLRRKYFGDQNTSTSRRSKRDANNKDYYIETAFTNSEKIRLLVDRAKNYIAVKNINLDNREVTEIFERLQEVVVTAENQIKSESNSETEKKVSIEKLENLLESLLTAKRNQITEQKEIDQNLKTYIQNNSATLTDGDSNELFIENYDANAINQLVEAEPNKNDLTYTQVNNLLSTSISAYRSQVFKIYNLALSKIKDIELIVQDFVLDFAAEAKAVRSASNIDEAIYQKLKEFNEIIVNAKNADYKTTENYRNKMDNLITILNSNKDGILSQFINKIKTEFDNKMDDSATTPGFYKKLINLLTPISQLIDHKDKNVYQYIGEEQLQDEIESIQNDYQSLLERYKSEIVNSTSSTNLSSFALSLNDLNQRFFTFQANIREKLLNLITQNVLVEVFSDLYAQINYNDSSNYTDEIKQKYQEFVSQYQNEISELIASLTPDFKFSIFDKASDFNTKIRDVLVKGVEFKDWITKKEHIDLLFKQITETVDIDDPLPENASQSNAKFDQKYKVIISNPEITRMKFLRKFEELNQNNETEYLDISDNDAFLDMFEQFSFTKKDIANDSQKASIFSNSTFKVKIKKYSPNSWFDLVPQATDDVDRKTVRMKLVFVYESPNSKIGKVEYEYPVTATFKTLDTIAIQNGNTSVFFDQGKVAKAARVLVFNVEEAGWKTGIQNEKNAMIQKAYNVFKKMVFDNNPNVDVHNRRKTLLIDSSTHSENYKFLFNTQEFLGLTYNISLYTPLDTQINRVFAHDGKKEIAFLQFLGGKTIGYPTRGANTGYFKPEVYDWSWRTKYKAVPSSNWWNARIDQIKPAVSVNLYKFTFDYDENTKNLYIYNSWVENSVFLHKGSIDVKKGFEGFVKNGGVKEAYRNWGKEVLEKWKSNPNYILSVEELTKFYAYYSMIDNDDKIFNFNKKPNPFGHLLLPVGESGLYGAVPVWPLNGGQATVNYWNNDPWNANLVPLAHKNDFAGKWDKGIMKESARQALYSTSIGEFWYKIRK